MSKDKKNEIAISFKLSTARSVFAWVLSSLCLSGVLLVLYLGNSIAETLYTIKLGDEFKSKINNLKELEAAIPNPHFKSLVQADNISIKRILDVLDDFQAENYQGVLSHLRLSGFPGDFDLPALEKNVQEISDLAEKHQNLSNTLQVEEDQNSEKSKGLKIELAEVETQSTALKNEFVKKHQAAILKLTKPKISENASALYQAFANFSQKFGIFELPLLEIAKNFEIKS